MSLRAVVLVFTLLVGIVYALNVPFYAGSDFGPLRWRMEHGRLNLDYNEVNGRENFYVAVNNEGMKFGFDGRWWSQARWAVSIPLWLPLLLGAAWSARLKHVAARASD